MDTFNEQAYLDGLQYLLTRGYRKGDRTGTGTRSVFGLQLRFDLHNNQFPLLTTKKLHTRSIFHELLWFLRGSTNNVELNDVGVTIWDEWAVPEDVIVQRPAYPWERASMLADKLGIPQREAVQMLTEADRKAPEGGLKLLDQHKIPATRPTMEAKKV